MKPVHRRILYGIQILRLDPGTAFKKCAKIVGDVMGSFHPHGDQAIYDALVRLAQDFSSRYPLVDGQGNFGNIDGDGAAAYRYTEARMTDVARLLLEGIDEDAVDFRDNYSGDQQEPRCCPRRCRTSSPTLTPPIAPPTKALPMIEGGNRMPTTAPTAMPPHAMCRVVVSSLLMWIFPALFFVTTAAS